MVIGSIKPDGRRFLGFRLRLACSAPTFLSVAIVLSTASVAKSDDSGVSRLPEISPVDRAYLTDLVRRTIDSRSTESRGESGSLYSPKMVPAELEHIECQVLVTLRQGGFVRGIGVSQRDNIIDAAREAAVLAGESAVVGGVERAELLDQMRVDIQVLGDVIPFLSEKNWTEPGALDGFLTPGLDGVMLFLDEEQRWFTAAEMISKNVSLTEALRTLSKEVTLNPQVLNEARLSKFRALHWWESDDAGHITSLVRGMEIVSQDNVTRRAIGDAIGRMGDYLIYRQLPDGRFTYKYNPAAMDYAGADSEVAQSGATWAVAELAGYRDTSAARRALRRAVQARMDQWVEFPAAHGAFLSEPDTENRLGVTAQFYLALSAAPDADRYEASRASLLESMLWLHQSDGAIIPAFPPATKLDTQERYSGQALLAMAKAYEREPSQQLLDALDQSFEFYRPLFEQRRLPAMVPWFGQAYGIMARLTRKHAYADFVYAMNDLTLEYQLTPANSDAAELWGAIEAPGVFGAGASTALFAQGFCEAAKTAIHFGDKQRYDLYREASLRAARFILQLEFKPNECYYVKSPTDVLGGIRTTPLDAALTIDSTQDALIALIRVDDLLFEGKP